MSGTRELASRARKETGRCLPRHATSLPWRKGKNKSFPQIELSQVRATRILFIV